ncbi:MAG: SDR family oxidoreductase [Proteobacteria bacterium]|nr:SDR family oxidoreductase [Pseudomonadota bacterium]
MNRLKDKKVIITGASKGIGKGIAKVFAKEGAHVLLVGRNEQALKKVVSEISHDKGIAQYYVGDVSNESDMNGMVDKAIHDFGGIDIMCINAGIYPQHWLGQMTLAQWNQVISTNLTSVFLATNACLPFMKKQKHGQIVITSSISGPKTGLPGFAHYTASKAGITGFIKTAAIELAKHNIRVNAVEPGIIMTEGVAEVGGDYGENQKKAVPLGELGTPEDVAYAALFLASDEAKFITGQTLVVDGGQVLPESLFMPFNAENENF